MKQRKRVEWSRLDNASKIFPATFSNKDTKVFRLSCELQEAVDVEILQQALNITLEHFPLYKSVLRKGVFWYYFQTSDLLPVVEIESEPLCAPVYLKDRKNLLFRVIYYHNRINLEVFHALSDGTGSLWFMKSLVYHYLLLMHKEAFTGKTLKLDYSASMSEKMDDSFKRYFEGKDIDLLKLMRPDQIKEKNTRAYLIRGSRLDENRMKMIEGAMSVKAVLTIAREYQATLTVFITGLLIYAIYEGMPARAKNRSVIISVPINLRNYFPSETARNFFSTMRVGHDFDKGGTELKDVLRSVNEGFQREMTEKRLNEHLNRLMSIEKNFLARIVPLPIKDFSLRLANIINDRGITAAISNIGKVAMPSDFSAYIRQFGVCISARKPHIGICSYDDRLVLSFTSPYRDTEIQRLFFEFLAERGIDIDITCNL